MLQMFIGRWICYLHLSNRVPSATIIFFFFWNKTRKKYQSCPKWVKNQKCIWIYSMCFNELISNDTKCVGSMSRGAFLYRLNASTEHNKTGITISTTICILWRHCSRKFFHSNRQNLLQLLVGGRLESVMFLKLSILHCVLVTTAKIGTSLREHWTNAVQCIVTTRHLDFHHIGSPSTTYYAYQLAGIPLSIVDSNI